MEKDVFSRTIVTIVSIVILTSSLTFGVFAWDESLEMWHPAEEIKPGSFSGDDFTFVDGVIVNTSFTVNSNSDFYNSINIHGASISVGNDLVVGNVAELTNETYIDGVKISVSANELNFLDGTTVVEGGVMFGDGAKITQDSANFFWDDTNKRLGVGLNNPVYSLEVDGSARLFGGELVGETTSASLRLDSTVGSRLTYQDQHVQLLSNGVKVVANGNDIVWIDESGQVGINTGLPVYDLDMNGSQRISGDLIVEGLAQLNNLNVSGFTILQGLNATDFIFEGNGNVTNDLYVDDNTFYVDSTNNVVGINNLNPNNALDVVGNIRGSNQIILDNSNVMNTIFTADNWIMRNVYTGGGWARNLLRFQDSASSDYWNIGAYGSGQLSHYGYIGSSWSDTSIKWKPGVGVTIGEGDGTDHPDVPLKVVGSHDTSTDVMTFGTGTSTSLKLTKTNSIEVDSTFYIQTNSANDLSLVNGGGNLGVGTDSPSYKLDVDGNVRVTEDLLVDSGKINGSNGEFVEIGTTNDQIKLQLSNGDNVLLNSNSLDLTGVTLPGDDIQDGTIDSSEIEDNTLTVDDLAASSVGSGEIIDESILAEDIGENQIGDSELFNGGDWIITSSLNIGTDGQALAVSADGYLSDEDDYLTVDDTLQVTGDLHVSGDTYINNLNVSGFTVVTELNGTSYNFDGASSVNDDFIVDSNTLSVDSQNNRVGVNILNPTESFHVVGGTKLQGNVEITQDLEFTDLKPNGAVCGPDQIVVKVADNDWRCSDYVEDQDQITVSVVGFTSAVYNGNLGGYDGANAKCNLEFSGSHICTVQEMLTTINYYDYKSDLEWTGTVWFSGGPPGFTANANDCKGFTSSNAGVLGRFWNLDETATGGMAWLTSCAQQKRLACCK